MKKSNHKFRVVEVFRAPQGEGFHLGKESIFVRFAGCNLGRGAGKGSPGDVCRFCDTDFSGFETMTLPQIFKKISDEIGAAPAAWRNPIILTGGEPLLQVDTQFILAILDKFPESHVHIETNGTVGREVQGALVACRGRVWASVSPKLGAPVVWTMASEVKVVVPGSVEGPGWTRDALLGIRTGIRAPLYWLMPQAELDGRMNVSALREYAPCLVEGWRFGIQAHKVWELK